MWVPRTQSLPSLSLPLAASLPPVPRGSPVVKWGRRRLTRPVDTAIASSIPSASHDIHPSPFLGQRGLGHLPQKNTTQGPAGLSSGTASMYQVVRAHLPNIVQ